MKAQCLVAPRSSSLCWSAIMVPVDESAPLVFSPCAQCGVAFGVCPRCYVTVHAAPPVAISAVRALFAPHLEVRDGRSVIERQVARDL